MLHTRHILETVHIKEAYFHVDNWLLCAPSCMVRKRHSVSWLQSQLETVKTPRKTYIYLFNKISYTVARCPHSVSSVILVIFMILLLVCAKLGIANFKLVTQIIHLEWKKEGMQGMPTYHSSVIEG